MPYSNGKAFVDLSGRIEYVALSINGLVVESTDDVVATDYVGGDTTKSRKEFYPLIDMVKSGKEVAAKLKNPSGREKLGKLKSSKLYLAYSKFGDFEALTIPGTAVGEMHAAIDDRHFYRINSGSVYGLDVGFYDMFFVGKLGEEQRLNSVLTLHSAVLRGLEPNLEPADRKTLECQVSQLVTKANGVYEKALEFMKQKRS